MNRKDLQALCQLRAREARYLLKGRHLAGAYYLLGYSVECGLKACIAKRVQRYDFPDKQLAQDVYTHSLPTLLKAAQLQQVLAADMRNNPVLELNWSIVKDWSERARYDPPKPAHMVNDFFSACTSRKNGILPWLKKHW